MQAKSLEAERKTLATVAQALEGLEQKWRDISEKCAATKGVPYFSQNPYYSGALSRCSDEIAAVRALIPQEKP